MDDCEIPYERFNEIEHVDMFPNWEAGIERLLLTFNIQTKSSKLPSPVSEEDIRSMTADEFANVIARMSSFERWTVIQRIRSLTDDPSFGKGYSWDYIDSLSGYEKVCIKAGNRSIGYKNRLSFLKDLAII